MIEPILWGLALAACAGLRLFMPFLFLSVMARYAHTPTPEMLSWVGTDVGFFTLLSATILESLGDKVPMVDHVLDSVQTLIKPIAGMMLPVALLNDASPVAAWTLGIAAGAPLALGVHATKAGTRVASTATTAGTANPIVSFFEDALAAVILVLTAIAPIIAALAVLALAIFVIRSYRRLRLWAGRSRTSTSAGPGNPPGARNPP